MLDLLLCLAAFTAWQLLLPPVSGRVALLGTLRGPRAGRGTRWTWLAPWPPAPGAVAAQRGVELRAQGVAPRFPRPGEARSAVGFAALEAARARGRRVVLGRRVLCRCITRRHAGRVAWLLRRLAPLAPGERGGLLAGLARAGLDEAAFARQAARCADPLRLLAWLAAASLLAATAAGLAAAWPRLEERALLLALAPLTALHLASVAALFRAHRAADPGDASGRLEAVFSALLFPPAAWTAAQHLRCELASRFHPALTAAALLAREPLLDFLRAELALLERADEEPETHAAERDLLGAERAALLRFAAGRGLSADELARPRERADVNAASYCVVCGSDYRPGFARCGDCAVPTLAYAPLRRSP